MVRLLRRLAIPVIAAGVFGMGASVSSGETIVQLGANFPLPTVNQVGTGSITITNNGGFNPSGGIAGSGIDDVALQAAFGTFNAPLTVTLTGFADSGLESGSGVQGLTNGTLTLKDAANGVVLATGTVTNATLDSNGSGSLLSGAIQYNAGSLYADFGAAHLTNAGDFVLSFGGPPTYTMVGGQVSGYTGTATSVTFDAAVAPLPTTASTGLALLGGLGVLGGVSVLRRRRQMA